MPEETILQPRHAVQQVDEGIQLAPRFGERGHLPGTTAGPASGLVQRVMALRVDDAEDTVWLREQVRRGHDSPPARCDVGDRRGLYHAIDPDTRALRLGQNA